MEGSKDMNKVISDWLNSQHLWLQEAASRLLTKGAVDDIDIADLVAIIKTPVATTKAPKPAPRKYPAFAVGGGSTAALRLASVGDIVGVDKLAPRRPLTFPTGNLTVIYGNNGSGKSGYARILKRACGKAGAPELRANVFEDEPPDRSCTIAFESAGVLISRKWAVNSIPIPELQSVDIFDSASGRLYLDSDTEVSFSPAELVFFSDLVEISKRVEVVFAAEKNALPKALPALPSAFQETRAGKLFASLSAKIAGTELSALYPWTEDDKENLKKLNAKRTVTNPAEEAKKRRALKLQINILMSKLAVARAAVTSIKCGEIFDLSVAAVAARKTATEGTAALTSSVLLDGVGRKTWKALWEAARAFSVGEVYPEKPFPNIEEGAKCVLCQQDLDGASKQRFVDFECFVTGTLETLAKEAETSVKQRLDALPEIPNQEALGTSCQAAGLAQDVEEQLKRAWSNIQSVINLLRIDPLEVKPEGIDIIECPLLAHLNALSISAEADALKYEEDAKICDGTKTTTDILELEAKYWTAGQARAIDAEINRLGLIAQITEWTKQTTTTGISRKASELSEALITEAYVNRFNSELRRLGAGRIQVELIKRRVDRAQVKHRVQLKGTNKHKAGEILSEGEQRIVSLAAFLASVTANPTKAPFIFDDPISSLDQDYEEKTIDRLIDLSSERQVIVMTHRLSFVKIVGDKVDPNVIAVRQEVWGTGQPAEVPIFAKNPEKSLNDLRDRRLAQARKVLFEDKDSESYYPLARAICTDFRILIERIVEIVLLADVIQRYRRDIHTKGKIDLLAKITKEDCQLVQKYMTKYSYYEHSQPFETPIEVPGPDELKADLDEVVDWLKAYKQRDA